MTTRSSHAEIWRHVREDILSIADDDPLDLSFKFNGINDLNDLFSLSERILMDMQYPDTSKQDNSLTDLPHGSKSLLRVLRAYQSWWCHQYDTPSIDWMNISKTDIDLFRVGDEYDPDEPIKRYRPKSNTVIKNDPDSNPSFKTKYDPVESFKRGIKRDKTHYKPLKNEKYWDEWHRSFRATANTHDMGHILDKDYVPDSQEDQLLFQEKQKFMYSVFDEHLLTDIGKTLVRKYEYQYDAQRIYTELVQHMLESGAGSLVAAELLQTITGTQMHKTRWQGTKRSFILSWNDNVRRYNGLVPLQERLTEPFLKTVLQNMVQGIPELDDLKTQEKMDMLRGHSSLTYSQYLQLITDKCDLLDTANSLASRTRKLSMNQHDVWQYDEYSSTHQEYEFDNITDDTDDFF